MSSRPLHLRKPTRAPEVRGLNSHKAIEDRTRTVFGFVRAHIARHGTIPSGPEIARQCNLTSNTAAHRTLSRLIRSGRIKITTIIEFPEAA